MKKFVLKNSETRFQNAETRFQNAKTALSRIFFARTGMDSAQKKPASPQKSLVHKSPVCLIWLRYDHLRCALLHHVLQAHKMAIYPMPIYANGSMRSLVLGEDEERDIIQFLTRTKVFNKEQR